MQSYQNLNVTDIYLMFDIWPEHTGPKQPYS